MTENYALILLFLLVIFWLCLFVYLYGSISKRLDEIIFRLNSIRSYQRDNPIREQFRDVEMETILRGISTVESMISNLSKDKSNSAEEKEDSNVETERRRVIR